MRLVGQTFGRYTILEHLAAGSELYVCEMGGLEGFARRVVAKLISEGSLGLIEQARTTATLNHPNLAQLIDVVRVPGGYFVVSEFIPGRSVREVQQRTASLGRVVPLAAVASIGAQAARVLGWLHLRQRPHGAVTPRNLMLGEDGAVKLTDLGISAALTRQEGSFEVSRYRPPEWTSGGSAAGDIFALGVVLRSSPTAT